MAYLCPASWKQKAWADNGNMVRRKRRRNFFKGNSPIQNVTLRMGVEGRYYGNNVQGPQKTESQLYQSWDGGIIKGNCLG